VCNRGFLKEVKMVDSIGDKTNLVLGNVPIGTTLSCLDGPVSGIFHVPVSAEIMATFGTDDMALVWFGYREINDGFALRAL
jgi:hypothetical protein